LSWGEGESEGEGEGEGDVELGFRVRVRARPSSARPIRHSTAPRLLKATAVSI
jgi:hypothetical protein